VAEKESKLLLVRVRQNEHWYLPGGKIEHGESPEYALQRELEEELGILIDPATVSYLYIVVGPAYGQVGEVELICFSARWNNDPQPHGEISEVQWLPLHQQEKFAPAVQILCNKFLRPKSDSVVLTSWRDLSPSDKVIVKNLSVSSQQVEYAGTMERAIGHCEEDTENDVTGLAIRINDKIVGFLLLKRRAKAPSWAIEGATTVAAMRIDLSHQGKGFGSMALKAISNWLGLNWPESSVLTLSVDEENIAGLCAYEKAGFRDHGVRDQGRIGWVRYMSKSTELPQ
jgi:ADP-ribose pyrophosphatase YjhB (NUDIX family)/RimJ/RimL family protein N-acetyltransferase